MIAWRARAFGCRSSSSVYRWGYHVSGRNASMQRIPRNWDKVAERVWKNEQIRSYKAGSFGYGCVRIFLVALLRAFLCCFVAEMFSDSRITLLIVISIGDNAIKWK